MINLRTYTYINDAELNVLDGHESDWGGRGKEVGGVMCQIFIWSLDKSSNRRV